MTAAESQTAQTTEQLRAEAAECGRRANAHAVRGRKAKAMTELNRARKLILMANAIEQAAAFNSILAD